MNNSLNTLKHIEKDHIPAQLYEIPVVIYGGGYMARIVMNLLIAEGIRIRYIIDDNEAVQGTSIENIKIISCPEFCSMAREYEQAAVILTTIYGKAVLKKLNHLPQIQVYELYDWYNELIGKDNEIANMVQEPNRIQEMKKQLEILKDKWADEESGNVFEGLLHYLETRDLNYIAEIGTDYEQYFIPEVKTAVRKGGGLLNILDGGAYRGELLQALKNNDIGFDKWYCFEADAENYEILLKRAKEEGLSEQQICINKGLWSDSQKLFFEEGEGTASRIVSYETEYVIDTISIDDYFGEGKCNYIKMDIEGAELPALKGGINLIKRERPILAISIYHSLEDFWKIPQYLMMNLDNYRYYVRHHALIFCETVLYAIPNEK